MFRILPLMLLTLSLMTACNAAEEKKATSSSELTFAVVDTARIFRDSEPGKAGVEFLKNIQGDMQIELATLQAKLQADPENAQLQQEAQIVFTQFQQRMNAEEQNVVNILNDLVQRTLDAHRAEKKYAIILGSESALSFDKSVDITSEVITAINTQKVTYKSIMPEEVLQQEPLKAPEKKEEQKEEEKPAQTQEEKAAPAKEEAKPEAAPAEKK